MGKYLISNMSEEEYEKEVKIYTSINFLLDWGKVKCYDGYYEYDPKKKIAMRDVPTKKIYSSECTPSFIDIIRKYRKRLPRIISWHIDTDFNIVLSDEELFKNAVPNLIKELEEEKYGNKLETDITISTNNKKYSLKEWNDFVEKKVAEQIKSNNNTTIFTEDHILNWNHIKCIKGYYIFIPIIDNFFVRTFIIEQPRCTKDYNRIINKYKETLPQIHFRINKNFEVEQFDSNLLKSSIGKAKRQEEEERIDNKEKKKLEQKYEELRKRGIDPSLFTKTFTLNWADVFFNKNYYTFDPNHNNSISTYHIQKLYINDSRSRESFNFIVKYLMKRMPVIRYQITDNFTIKLLEKYKPTLEVAINFLVKEQSKYDIGIGEIAETIGHKLNAEKLTFASAMSKAASMRPEDFKKYKSQFINYLILQQDKKYKVVPMSESITNSNITYEEATFIFTTKSWDNNLLLIIENVNPDRSTIVFKVLPKLYKDALQTIFDFMQSNLVNKRSGIRDKSLTFSDCGIIDYWSCNHDSFNDWKERMRRHIGIINQQ